MSDEASAPAGGDSAFAPAVSAPAPQATPSNEPLSVSDAARALQAARRKPQPEAAPQEAAAEPELAQANADPETAPSEDTNAAEQEDNLPLIEPPRSWTKAEKDRFNTLPRETQEYLHTREQERERDFRRSQNEVADQRKAIEVERQSAAQLKAQYEAQLPALMQQLQNAQNGEFADVRNVDDVTRLASEDPFRYLQWQAHQTKLQAVNAESERARGEQTRQQQAQWNDYVSRENVLAAEYIPELADKTKAAALTNRAAETLSELGFKPSELADMVSGKEKVSLFDHRIQRLIFNSLKLADIQGAKTAAVAKPLPPVQRPGTARPQGAAQSEALRDLTNRLNSSGSLKDAAALRAAQMRRR